MDKYWIPINKHLQANNKQKHLLVILDSSMPRFSNQTMEKMAKVEGKFSRILGIHYDTVEYVFSFPLM